MLKNSLIFPFILAVIPVLALYQNNAREVPPGDLLRPVLFSLLIPAIVLAAFRAVSRKRNWGSILAALLVVALYAYPLVFVGWRAWGPAAAGARHGPPLFAWSLLVAGVCGAGIAAARRWAVDPEKAIAGLNVFALSLGLLVGGQAADQYRRATVKPSGSSPSTAVTVTPGEAHSEDPWVAQALAAVRATGPHHLPDIYYVILDGYAREDILESRFHFRNRELLDWLRAQGFFIADKSHCNYAWTHLGLAATFNLDYVQNWLPAGYGREAPEEYRSRYKFFTAKFAAEYIQQSRVRRLLEVLGYQIITADTGYAVTRHTASEKTGLGGPLTQFERTLIRKTVFWPLAEAVETRASNPGADARTANERPFPQPAINRNLRLLQDLPAVAGAAGPKFVFYHVMAPHPPFCFDGNGKIIRPHPVFEASSWLVDCQAIPGYRDFYRTHYPLNVAGLNVRLRTALEALGRQTRGRAVVILQSDHGSQLGLDPFDAEKADLPERFGILNAIYLPPRYSCAELDKDLSAVNTFRIVFRCLFGLDLPRLEDRAWFSTGDLSFTEVTDRLR